MAGEVKFQRRTFSVTTGSDEELLQKLKEGIPGLREERNVENCDVFLVFCCVNEHEAALKELQELPEPRHVVLVVLCSLGDPGFSEPDSSRRVNGENTLTVHYLIHEDKGLLQDSRNQDVLKRVTEFIKRMSGENLEAPGAEKLEQNTAEKSDTQTVVKEPGVGSPPENTAAANTEEANSGRLKFCRSVSGRTLGSDDGFIRKLKEEIPDLTEVYSVEDCDVILAFCPVASRAGTDIKSALDKLQHLPVVKQMVLVVLHHTFDLEFTAPNSSRCVKRENTLTVDCLFHEDRGLLQCYRNNEALQSVTHWIKPPVKCQNKSVLKSFTSFFNLLSSTTGQVPKLQKNQHRSRARAEPDTSEKIFLRTKNGQPQEKRENLNTFIMRTLPQIIDSAKANQVNCRRVEKVLSEVLRRAEELEGESVAPQDSGRCDES